MPDSSHDRRSIMAIPWPERLLPPLFILGAGLVLWGATVIGAALGTLSLTSSFFAVFPFGTPLWTAGLVTSVPPGSVRPSAFIIKSSFPQFVVLGVFVLAVFRPRSRPLHSRLQVGSRNKHTSLVLTPPPPLRPGLCHSGYCSAGSGGNGAGHNPFCPILSLDTSFPGCCWLPLSSGALMPLRPHLPPATLPAQGLCSLPYCLRLLTVGHQPEGILGRIAVSLLPGPAAGISGCCCCR